MLNFKTVNRDQVKQTGAFQILPKGAYVVKIINNRKTYHYYNQLLIEE